MTTHHTDLAELVTRAAKTKAADLLPAPDTASKTERNHRYRHGLCVDCGTQPHSAGRPRCQQCHHTHTNPPSETTQAVTHG